MPAPGDQYRATPASTNPFEETVPRISEYTAQEIAILSSRLDKQLGPEYISTRPGQGGGKVHYLAAEKVINLANEVFGFNGWSSQIQNVQIDFVDESQGGKISLGLSTIVRVTLKDGTFHEDIGYGHIENCKGKAAAFEKAKKEAATDALKRSLRNFGNVLGNCLYDKDYLQRITKVKIAPSKWDAENLHRHQDFRPIKRESIAGPGIEERPAQLVKQHSILSNNTEFEDEFGGNLFDEVELPDDHPDEVTIHSRTGGQPPEQQQQQRPPIHNQGGQPAQHKGISNATNQNNKFAGQTQAQQQQRQVPAQKPVTHQQQGPSSIPATHNQMPPPQGGAHSFNRAATNDTPQNQPRTQPALHQEHNVQALPLNRPSHQNSTPPSLAQTNTESAIHEPLVGFTSGRATITITAQDSPVAPEALANLPRFNPKAESPSIRRTVGFDHTKSGKVTRTSLDEAQVNPPPLPIPSNGTSMANTPGPLSRSGSSNFINPSGDSSRKIGMPGGGVPSPLANRNAYRPPGPAPSNKRPYVAQTPDSRFPLADVSNTTGTVSQNSGNESTPGDDSKRQKVMET